MQKLSTNLKINNLSELHDVILKMKVLYQMCKESKLEENIEQLPNMISKATFKSNDSSMLDYLYQKAGGEFKKDEKGIQTLEIIFKTY